MIDATAEVVSAPAKSGRRQSAPAPSTRGSKIPMKATKKNLRIARVFSDAKVNPFDQIEWESRTAEITDDGGKVIFKQENVEVPKSWSLLATKVVVSKYFYGEQDTPERETSVRQFIHRICRTIADWGVKDGYFSKADGEVFYEELAWLCVNQYGAFNSPVWFNVGLYHQYGVGNDSSRGNWYYNRKTEPDRARPHPIRISRSAAPASSSPSRTTWSRSCTSPTARPCSSSSAPAPAPTFPPSAPARKNSAAAGAPADPLSFLKVYDQVANVVKSGGKTRRAAKMNTLRDWHGDIEEFIDAKQKEEKKAWALIEQGYDGSYNGDAYGSVMYQNENLSVRVSDEFMQAALEGGEWWTRIRHHRQTAGEEGCQRPAEQDRRRHLDLRRPRPAIRRRHPKMAYLQRHRAHPLHQPVLGIRFSQQHRLQSRLAEPDEVQARGRSCSMSSDSRRPSGCIITAQEILVDNASYPTAGIAENSHIFRTLGLGYANLGSLIMSYGLPYDSNEGRALAGAITAIMTGHAYEQSASLASVMGPSKAIMTARCAHVPKPAAPDNVASMLDVIRQHRQAVEKIQPSEDFHYLKEEARRTWDAAIVSGEAQGYRNAQVTVLAPTGTIAFLMDCDTTGVEPDIALVKYKLLAGGGMLKIVNRTVPDALRRLGYSAAEIESIIAHIEKYDTIEDVEEDGQAVRERPQAGASRRCSTAPSRLTRANAASITWPI